MPEAASDLADGTAAPEEVQEDEAGGDRRHHERQGRHRVDERLAGELPAGEQPRERDAGRQHESRRRQRRGDGQNAVTPQRSAVIVHRGR